MERKKCSQVLQRRKKRRKRASEREKGGRRERERERSCPRKERETSLSLSLFSLSQLFRSFFVESPFSRSHTGQAARESTRDPSLLKQQPWRRTTSAPTVRRDWFVVGAAAAAPIDWRRRRPCFRELQSKAKQSKAKAQSLHSDIQIPRRWSLTSCRRERCGIARDQAVPIEVRKCTHRGRENRRRRPSTSPSIDRLINQPQKKKKKQARPPRTSSARGPPTPTTMSSFCRVLSASGLTRYI